MAWSVSPGEGTCGQGKERAGRTDLCPHLGRGLLPGGGVALAGGTPRPQNTAGALPAVPPVSPPITAVSG